MIKAFTALLMSGVLCSAYALIPTAFASGNTRPKASRPVIKNLVIEVNAGASDQPETPPQAIEPCDDFILTESDVREFFKEAKIISAREYDVVLDHSRCFVRGSAVLKDGRKAGWTIDRFRRGWMWFSDKSDMYFFGATARSDKYYEACDAECQKEQ